MKRETTGLTKVPDFPTAAAVAEEIHAGWYLIRDSCRSREIGVIIIPVVSRFARDHRLPYEPPSAGFRADLLMRLRRMKLASRSGRTGISHCSIRLRYGRPRRG